MEVAAQPDGRIREYAFLATALAGEAWGKELAGQTNGPDHCAGF